MAVIREDKDREMVKRGKAEGLASKAKIKADQFRKSYEANEEEIASVKTDRAVSEDAFKTKREAMKKIP